MSVDQAIRDLAVECLKLDMIYRLPIDESFTVIGRPPLHPFSRLNGRSYDLLDREVRRIVRDAACPS